ncbi:MAG: deoxyribonuclease IV [Geodermatophilaceae bacterium]|nr:deoxyribonuclease IV [Geodermatophilaceae bacterium]
MQIGAHVRDGDPLTAAHEVDADLVQFFLTDPQGYKAPKPRADAEQIREADVGVFIHAPYIVNVASTNNRIRIPSRKLLAQHTAAAVEVGARGVIVHGGHVTADDEIEAGVDNWRKTVARQAAEGGYAVPILLENTAGGDRAMARRFDALARLWDAIGEYDVGFCLDTCHAHAGGEELLDIVDRVLSITGRIDLVHCNNSRDGFDSGRDRHAHLESGRIDPQLLLAVARDAGAPVICETPADRIAEDIAFLRSGLG